MITVNRQPFADYVGVDVDVDVDVDADTELAHVLTPDSPLERGTNTAQASVRE